MRIRAFTLALLMTVCAPMAFGFTLEGQTWPQNSTVVMQLSLGNNSGTLIDGFTSFGQSAEDALALWNQNLGRLQFGVVRNSTVSSRSGDLQNSVFFSNTVFGDAFSADTIAVTVRRFQNTTLIEADVVFNTAMPYNSYRGPLRNTQSGTTLVDFHRVALHEFGHVLGLDHPDKAGQTVVAVMNSRESDTDSLQPDDIAGGQFLYGAPAQMSANNLLNVSTRAFVGTGDRVVIGGFIIQGSPSKAVAIRAIGPSLTALGVAGALPDPVLDLRDAAGNVIQSNDDWRQGPEAATLQSKGLAPRSDFESALIASLPAGNYTALVHGYNDVTGIGLVELYDLGGATSRAGNISTRGLILTNDNVMIGGFIVGGNQNKPVVVRAIGPSLASAGVSGALIDPTLELLNTSGMLLASNDNWKTDPNAT
ncbi:MAG: matrixin family metalloprotease, partial [Chthoniobacterales bacterium]